VSDDHPFPTITQYASEDLINAFANEGRAHDDGPRWAESGAPDVQTYGRWNGHMCGIACLRMARVLPNRHRRMPWFQALCGAPVCDVVMSRRRRLH
jgi:hypothetical protein